MSIIGNILEVAAGVKLAKAWDAPPSTIEDRVQRLEALCASLSDCLNVLGDQTKKICAATSEQSQMTAKAFSAIGADFNRIDENCVKLGNAMKQVAEHVGLSVVKPGEKQSLDR